MNPLKKQKLHSPLYWLIHPAALAFYVFLILLLSLPKLFLKYDANIISSKPGLTAHFHYEDLNNNGKEELARTAYNSGETPKLLVTDYNGNTINQWNFKGKWLEDRIDMIGDYDDNKLKEICCLTYDKDSIFLSVIEPFNPESYIRKDRFIDILGTFNHDKFALEFVNHKLIDTNDDGFKEYVFILYAGFSKFPRKVYVYDIKNDTLFKSPDSAAGMSIRCYFEDVNNDGVEEVCGKITAHENIHYPAPYTDSSSWVMVFNLKNNVEFLFPPIEHNTGIGSEIITFPYRFKDTTFLASILHNRSAKQNTSFFQLSLYSSEGKLIKSKKYSKNQYPHLSFLSTPESSDNFLYLYDYKGNIYKTDTSLIIKEHHILKEALIINVNRENFIKLNNTDTYVFFATKLNRGIVFYSKDLKDHLFIEISSLNESSDWRIFSRTPTADNPSNLVINGTNRNLFVQYEKNPFYDWRFPIYLISYLLLFFMFWLLQKAQKSMLGKYYETERLLMQQQMALSKRQMEPHFMLNMVNNIGYMFLKEDKQTGIYYLGKFADLLRKGLINADKIKISLEEELEFVNNYLIIQKRLMDDNLVFSVIVDEQIEEDKIEIPHSIIYTFVENAIKHGLKPKTHNRKLEIHIKQIHNRIKINICDNGIGREKSKEFKTSDTGKGLEIVKTIINGYNQLYGGNISYTTEDLKDDLNSSNGTKVIINI